MKSWVLILIAATTLVHAALPEKPIAPQRASWETLRVRLDVRNLTTENNLGELSSPQLSSIIEGANRYWSQCGIQFLPRSINNVNVLPLNIPYEPKSQDDLSKIAEALNPNGFKGAIPFTVAGKWTFSENNFTLFGLGWVFLNSPTEVNRIGAMVDAGRLKEEWIGQLAAHELGHTLSLPHHTRADNIMTGGHLLTPEQCEQARLFSQGPLASFLEKTTNRAAIQAPKDTI